MKRLFRTKPMVCFLSLLLLLTSGCSSKHPLKFNIHTEPEGAHVVYQVDSDRWIYLGITPLDAIEVMGEEELEGEHTLTLKAMRCGYLEQTKEWTGDNLFQENEDKGMIFWTPRLIKNNE